LVEEGSGPLIWKGFVGSPIHGRKALSLSLPNNPTGAVTSAEQIKEVVVGQSKRPCPDLRRGFRVLFWRGKVSRPIALARPDLCFTLNGISKMFALPGLNLSWIAVSGERKRVDAAVDRLETMNDTFLSCHIPIQEALPSLFSEGRDFLNHYRKEVTTRRALALQCLRSQALEIVSPEGGFYLMASVRKNLPISEEEVVIRLMKEKDLFVHPGYFYDYEKGIHLVVSLLLKPETQEAVLPRLTRFIESL
jgi:aspartate/methionine/tyrosine aminotransferase